MSRAADALPDNVHLCQGHCENCGLFGLVGFAAVAPTLIGLAILVLLGPDEVVIAVDAPEPTRCERGRR